jgi:hypothetical protein
MADTTTLKDALEIRGPYAVWDLMTEDERAAAAAALWNEGDRDTRAAIELALAKEMKFRVQSLRKVSTERLLGRLVRMADKLPDTVLFQFLFHLHMADRRPLLAAFLDAVGLPHEDGVLNLDDDAEDPAVEKVTAAAQSLVADHGHEALVYLATLRVADADFWGGVDPVLEGFDDHGEAVAAGGKPAKKSAKKSADTDDTKPAKKAAPKKAAPKKATATKKPAAKKPAAKK